MKVLIETRMNSLKLTESKAPKKGCLGRLEGVCADFKNPTRNGRLYPLNLWKKVFDDTLFKESLQNKTLFGELDHPEDRFEPLIAEACVVMTDYRIDEDKGLIYGGFDILDTPKGRILKSIVDYGSVVGVSSRGQGDIIESTDGERVDEDSYEFACFDVVSTPAVEKARQNVMESIKRVKDVSFKESIDKQIEDAETVSDLNIIRSVVRSSNIDESEMDTIIESIEDRCNNLQKADKTIVASKEDSVETLKESAKTIRDNKQLYSCIKSLRSQVAAYKHRENRYVESINEGNEKLQESARKVRMLQRQLNEEKKRTDESVRQKRKTDRLLSERIKTSSSDLMESKRVISDLRQKNKELQETLSNALRTNKMDLEKQDTKLSEVQEKLSKSNERVAYLESVFDKAQTEHSNEVHSLDSEINNYSSLLQEAQQRLESKTSTIKKLTESVETMRSDMNKQKSTINSLLEQLNSYQKQFVDNLSTLHDVDSKSIMKKVTPDMKPNDVQNLVESVRDKLDRYNKFPISQNSITDSEDVVLEKFSKSGMSEDEKEDQRLSKFVLNVTEAL